MLALMCFTINLRAQTVPPAPITGVEGSQYPVYDTNTSTGTTVTQTRAFIISGQRDVVALQVDVTKISGSGTVHGWVNFNVGIDTGALKDTTAGVTVSYYYNAPYNAGYYWSTGVTTTNTCSVQSAVWQLPRK